VTGTDQRYYNSNAGRFYTPDPSGRKAVNLKNPTSWNMYAYTNDDPVNFNDPRGLELPSLPGDWGGDDGCTVNGLIPAPSPLCGYPGPVLYDPPSTFTSTTLCSAANGLSPDQQIAVQTVMGENSWWRLGQLSYLPSDTYGHPTGPTITSPIVFLEDLDMFSVLTNRATAQGTTIGAVASQPGQFAGYSNGKNGGITQYNAAINSPQGSSPCNDLTEVVYALDEILRAGSLLPSNYQYWKAILQPGGLHKYHPGDIYVGNTAFGTVN
jgi:RHS repeat-associated protein